MGALDGRFCGLDITAGEDDTARVVLSKFRNKLGPDPASAYVCGAS